MAQQLVLRQCPYPLILNKLAAIMFKNASRLFEKCEGYLLILPLRKCRRCRQRKCRDAY